MKTYRYVLTSKENKISLESRKRNYEMITPSIRYHTITIDDDVDPYTEIVKLLLSQKRERRYLKLLKSFTGNHVDKEQLAHFLDPAYEEYLNDVGRLKEQLCSVYEIVSKYNITEIGLECEGCKNGLSGQDEHMSCYGGCLHDPNLCIKCS